jgi:hypothetical protein
MILHTYPVGMQYVVNQCAAEVAKVHHKILVQQLVTGVITGVVIHHGILLKIHCSRLRELIR